MRAPAWFLILLAGLPAAIAEVITLHSGERRAGRIAELNGSGIRLEVPLDRTGGSPVLATVLIPRASIRSVDFGSSPDLEEILSLAGSQKISRLAALWSQGSAWIDVPTSPAGRIGVAFGDALAATGEPASVARALEVYRQVEDQSWDPGDRAAAKTGRLRALTRNGRAGEAAAEAEQIARSTRDPTLLVEARLQLAAAAMDALEKLQQDNPRWSEDPLIGPERSRLYEEALDLSLYPAVCPGAPPAAAARGLWLAARIHRIAGNDRAAAECARDIVEIHPASNEAAPAAGLIASIPAAPPVKDASAPEDGPGTTGAGEELPDKTRPSEKKSRSKNHEAKTKKTR